MPDHIADSPASQMIEPLRASADTAPLTDGHSPEVTLTVSPARAKYRKNRFSRFWRIGVGFIDSGNAAHQRHGTGANAVMPGRSASVND